MTMEIHTLGGHWAAVSQDDERMVEIVTSIDGMFVFVAEGENELLSEFISFNDNPEVLNLWQGDDQWDKAEVLKFCDNLFRVAVEPCQRINSQIRYMFSNTHILRNYALKKRRARLINCRVYNMYYGYQWDGLPY